MSWRDGPCRDLAWENVFIMPGALIITNLGTVSIGFAVSRLFPVNKDFFSRILTVATV